MKPRISIAMATYNGAKYIEEQLESFAKQIYQPFELIISDDCSSDETVSLAERFAKRSSFPVKIVVNASNLGFSNNFLKSLQYCSGDWISFSDQDDIWLPQKLLRVSECINKYSQRLVLVSHSAYLANEYLEFSGRQVPHYSRFRYSAKSENHGFICLPGFTITFKAQIVNGIDHSLRPRDYFEMRKTPLSHDKWIPMLANIQGGIVRLPNALAIYRRHETALSGSYPAHTIHSRIEKSLAVGRGFYRFQAKAASECAHALEKTCQGLNDKTQRQRFQTAANNYNLIKKIFIYRSLQYSSKSRIRRLLYIFKILSLGGYFGRKFISLGPYAFLKDLYTASRV